MRVASLNRLGTNGIRGKLFILFGALLVSLGLSAASADDKLALVDYGRAPELTGITAWLNSKPLTLAELRGNVVLIDFWTFGCVNCIRTLPHVTQWHARYKDKGLVVVGVHTPEFPHERSIANLERAIKRHDIAYPVAQDNHYATWKAFENRYWPAKYLIDRNGRIVYKHFGEGNYEETERAIRKLLEGS